MKASLDKKIYFINVISLLSFSILIFYLLYTSLSEQKDSLISEAKVKTESLAKFMSSDIDRFVLSVGEIIEGIHNVDEFIEEHTEDMDEHNHEVDNILRKSMRPYLMNILILDENIKAIHWANEENQESIENIGYIYSHFEETHSKETLLSTPVISKSLDHKWFFSISKGYYVDNHLHSVIIVFFDAGFFKTRYNDHIHSSFFISSPKGNIYLHDPEKDKPKTSLIKRIKAFGHSGLGLKNYYIDSKNIEQPEISTYIRSENNPVIVGVSLLAENILAPWEDHKQQVYIIAFILSAGFFILIFYYTKMQNKLVRLTRYDSLTKLFNRGYFTKLAEYEYKRAKRLKEDLSVLMIDIDKFKKINDSYGHKKGAEIIKSITNDIKTSIREIDLAGRYGGEEFIVLLPKTDIQEAFAVAKRIQEAIELSNQSLKIGATVSFGISLIKEEDKNLDAVIVRADDALYLSKEKGRNCINIC